MAERGLGTKAVAWIFTVIVALMMVPPGLTKLTQAAGWATRFAGWGLPEALVPIVGVAELLGGALLLIPPLATLGGGVVSVVMLGATLTHLLNDEIVRTPLTLGLTVAAVALAWYRRDQFAIGRARGQTGA